MSESLREVRARLEARRRTNPNPNLDLEQQISRNLLKRSRPTSTSIRQPSRISQIVQQRRQLPPTPTFSPVLHSRLQLPLPPTQNVLNRNTATWVRDQPFHPQQPPSRSTFDPSSKRASSRLRNTLRTRRQPTFADLRKNIDPNTINMNVPIPLTVQPQNESDLSGDPILKRRGIDPRAVFDSEDPLPEVTPVIPNQRNGSQSYTEIHPLGSDLESLPTEAPVPIFTSTPNTSPEAQAPAQAPNEVPVEVPIEVPVEIPTIPDILDEPKVSLAQSNRFQLKYKPKKSSQRILNQRDNRRTAMENLRRQNSIKNRIGDNRQDHVGDANADIDKSVAEMHQKLDNSIGLNPDPEQVEVPDPIEVQQEPVAQAPAPTVGDGSGGGCGGGGLFNYMEKTKVPINTDSVAELTKKVDDIAAGIGVVEAPVPVAEPIQVPIPVAQSIQVPTQISQIFDSKDPLPKAIEIPRQSVNATNTIKANIKPMKRKHVNRLAALGSEDNIGTTIAAEVKKANAESTQRRLAKTQGDDALGLETQQNLDFLRSQNRARTDQAALPEIDRTLIADKAPVNVDRALTSKTSDVVKAIDNEIQIQGPSITDSSVSMRKIQQTRVPAATDATTKPYGLGRLKPVEHGNVGYRDLDTYMNKTHKMVSKWLAEPAETAEIAVNTDLTSDYIEQLRQGRDFYMNQAKGTSDSYNTDLAKASTTLETRYDGLLQTRIKETQSSMQTGFDKILQDTNQLHTDNLFQATELHEAALKEVADKIEVTAKATAADTAKLVDAHGVALSDADVLHGVTVKKLTDQLADSVPKTTVTATAGQTATELQKNRDALQTDFDKALKDNNQLHTDNFFQQAEFNDIAQKELQTKLAQSVPKATVTATAGQTENAKVLALRKAKQDVLNQKQGDLITFNKTIATKDATIATEAAKLLKVTEEKTAEIASRNKVIADSTVDLVARHKEVLKNLGDVHKGVIESAKVEVTNVANLHKQQITGWQDKLAASKKLEGAGLKGNLTKAEAEMMGLGGLGGMAGMVGMVLAFSDSNKNNTDTATINASNARLFNSLF